MANIAILSFYSGIVERGVETFVYELSKRLKSKHKISIFMAGQTIYEPGIRTVQIVIDAKSPKEQKGILSKFYLDPQSLKILVFSLLATPQILKGKFNIIISLNGSWQVVIFRIISKITGAKLIVVGQAGIGADDAWNIFFRPDLFVALTFAQKKWSEDLAPEVKVSKISNGVDLSKFNPKVKGAKILLNKPIVVCTSALEPYKQVDLTIKAVAKAKNLSLLVLGDGQDRGYIDSLGKRLLGKRYLRLVVEHNKIPSFYRVGGVFTLVSKTEAFGTSYIEAMACNLPVVATCDKSRQEIIGNAGILTDPKNLNQYAKDLEIAAKTNYRNIPYDQALKFSWNKIASDYHKVILSLIKDR